MKDYEGKLQGRRLRRKMKVKIERGGEKRCR